MLTDKRRFEIVMLREGWLSKLGQAEKELRAFV
jgi:hypothetical protein